jgi:hypothetical protein
MRGHQADVFGSNIRGLKSELKMIYLVAIATQLIPGFSNKSSL